MMRGRGLVNGFAMTIAAFVVAPSLHAEDDYALWLRHAPPEGEALHVRPAMPLRMRDHRDNPDGRVGRGYPGRSINNWWHLPERHDPQLISYARAFANIGINAVAVNHVNALAFMLEARNITELERLADAWRPFGIGVFLSARFSAPMELGGPPARRAACSLQGAQRPGGVGATRTTKVALIMPLADTCALAVWRTA